MGKIAFVFPGQGAQYPGMGRELYELSQAAKEVFDCAEKIRPGVSERCFRGPKEELDRTINTQPCVFCVGMAAAGALREAGVIPDMTAGFSLGEIPALTYAKALTCEEAFSLVCARASRMQACAEAKHGAMAAVLGLADEAVEALCGQYAELYPVNYNCPGQVVIAGREESVVQAAEAAREMGGKAVRLAVNGAFHSPYMASAAKMLADDLNGLHFGKTCIPVYANATGQIYGENIGEMLRVQLRRPVLWQKTIENMAADGADTFIETGPGRVLGGLIRKILPDAALLHVQDAKSLKETIEKMNGV